LAIKNRTSRRLRQVWKQLVSYDRCVVVV